MAFCSGFDRVTSTTRGQPRVPSENTPFGQPGIEHAYGTPRLPTNEGGQYVTFTLDRGGILRLFGNCFGRCLEIRKAIAIGEQRFA